MQNNKNILLATTLSAFVLLAWTWIYEKPRLEKQEAQRIAVQKEISQNSTIIKAKNNKIPAKLAKRTAKKQSKAVLALKNRDEILKNSDRLRVEIKSDSLHGSIFLKGPD